MKWPDGKLYGAKYLGTNTAHMYQVSVYIYYHVLVFEMSLLQVACSALALEWSAAPSKQQKAAMWTLIVAVNAFKLMNKAV